VDLAFGFAPRDTSELNNDVVNNIEHTIIFGCESFLPETTGVLYSVFVVNVFGEFFMCSLLCALL
jgi:hypothetical protein